jgi:hypothetical protein
MWMYKSGWAMPFAAGEAWAKKQDSRQKYRSETQILKYVLEKASGWQWK